MSLFSLVAILVPSPGQKYQKNKKKSQLPKADLLRLKTRLRMETTRSLLSLEGHLSFYTKYTPYILCSSCKAIRWQA
jgi:hypothetical protein